MTIKIEREALICVLSRPPSTPSTSRTPCDATTIPSVDEEFVLVDVPKSLTPGSGDVFFNEGSCFRRRSPSWASDDDCTHSTGSLSTDTSYSIERQVSFSSTLVTEEWTRPRTPKEDVPNLFYSTDETQR